MTRRLDQTLIAFSPTVGHDEAPLVPLVHKVDVAAFNASADGFRVHPSGFFDNFKTVRKD